MHKFSIAFYEQTEDDAQHGCGPESTDFETMVRPGFLEEAYPLLEEIDKLAEACQKAAFAVWEAKNPGKTDEEPEGEEWAGLEFVVYCDHGDVRFIEDSTPNDEVLVMIRELLERLKSRIH